MNPLILFLACTEIKDSGESPLEPMLTGTILPDTPAPSGESVSGEFFGYHAFSFLVDDKFVTYISSNPNSTCSKVVDYLNINGDPYDPVDVLEPGGCNMYIEVEGFTDGSYSASNDVIASASSAIACAINPSISSAGSAVSAGAGLAITAPPSSPNAHFAARMAAISAALSAR